MERLAAKTARDSCAICHGFVSEPVFALFFLRFAASFFLF
jgi:hypothetical protein